MFVNVPTISMSLFYINAMCGCDNPSEHDIIMRNHYLKKRKNGANHIGLDGGYVHADPQFGFLHPLHVYYLDDDYGRLRLNNIRSRLKRNRRMKETWYAGWIMRKEDEPFEDYKKRLKAAQRATSVVTYGTADSVEQVYQRFDFLNKLKDRFFFISFGRIDKDQEPEWGGFRQHKNGPYIGNKEMQHEYFAHEGPEFEYIIQYHIYEVVMSIEPGKSQLESEHFKYFVDANNERRTHMTIISKETDDIICYLFGGKDEVGYKVGDGMKTLFTVDNISNMDEVDAKLIQLVRECKYEVV